MLAAIGTLVFLASLWLAIAVAVRTLAGSGTRIVEALQGRPSQVAAPAELQIARVRWFSEEVRPARRLRAAA